MTNEEVEAQARAYKLELRKEYERGMLDAIEVFKGIASDQRKTLSAMDLPLTTEVLAHATVSITAATTAAFERRVLEKLLAARDEVFLR